MFSRREAVRAIVAEWLESFCRGAWLVEDLQPVFGGCMIDLVAVKAGAMTGVIIPTGGVVTELQARVECAQEIAESLWVAVEPEFEAVTLANVPVESGVLVVDVEERIVSIRAGGRRNMVDPRAMARLLSISELQAATGLVTRDYSALVGALVDHMTGLKVRETACRAIIRRGEPRQAANVGELVRSRPKDAPVARAAGMMIAGAVSLCAIFGGSTMAKAATIEGPARAIDGDTIDIKGQRIRLWGVDAVERSQTCDANGRPYACGEKATGELAYFLGFEPVKCEVVDTDKYGRKVSRCTSKGRDVAGFMVQSGWALDYTQYSKGAYLTAETRARAMKVGMFAGTFQKPEDYRRVRSAEARLGYQRVSMVPADGCKIKGNISRSGERIFHEPGQVFYDQTTIDTKAGERWFCSAGEAVAAGWVRAVR